MSKILCSWIGGTDWLVQEGTPREEDDLGPILRTLRNKEWAEQVSEIRLLNNYPGRKSAVFKKWLAKETKAKIICKDVELTSPTSFTEVDQAATALVRSLPEDAQLIYLCSPGTYVMSSVWILLSHNQFPATLIETSPQADVKEIDVPFNISVRDLIDRADRARAELSDGRRTYFPEFEEIQHDCKAMREAIAKAANLARRKISVLIEGETGTGRELLARCIHKKSGKTHFDSINCSAYSPEQLERELFGVFREEAKAGETRKTRGLFQRGRDSTLYIAEVDSIPGYLQTRLLQEITKNKGTTKQRLIFSTATPLGESVAEENFRRDLFYQITEDVITLPPLRDRGIKDLNLICATLMRRLRQKLKDEASNMAEKELDRSAMRALEIFPFEGNVRELETVLARAMLHTTANVVNKEDIETALTINRSSQTIDSILSRPLDDDFVLDDVLDEVTRHYLARAKTSTRSLRQAAKALGFKNYQTLANRIKKLEGFDW